MIASRLLLVAGALLYCLTVQAAPVAAYRVSLDTSALIGGSYSLEFQLNDGDGVQNSLVTLQDFDFGGGNAIAGPLPVGGVTGDAAGGVTMQDLFFFNEFIQGFDAGSTLRFSVVFESDADGGVPDQLSFAILDSSAFELPTTGSGNQLLSIDALNGAFQVSVYDGIASAGQPTLAAPTVTAVPEPDSLALVALAGLLLPLARRGR